MTDAAQTTLPQWLVMTGLRTPSISGGRRPSLRLGQGVQAGLAHRAAWLGA